MSERRAEQISELLGDTSLPDDHVVVEVGNDAFHPGRTRVELRADGRLLVSSRLRGTEERFESWLESDRALRLFDELTPRVEGSEGESRVQLSQVVQNVVARILQGRSRRSVNPPVPDEPLYHIEILRGSDQPQAIDVWRHEVPRYPELARALDDLNARVQTMSEGRATL